jgi:hypothetical protein
MRGTSRYRQSDCTGPESAIWVHARPSGTVAGRRRSPARSVGCWLALQRVQEVRDLGVDGTGMGDVGGVRSPIYQGERGRAGQAVAHLLGPGQLDRGVLAAVDDQGGAGDLTEPAGNVVPVHQAPE